MGKALDDYDYSATQRVQKRLPAYPLQLRAGDFWGHMTIDNIWVVIVARIDIGEVA
jgi:hypothetical protein